VPALGGFGKSSIASAHAYILSSLEGYQLGWGELSGACYLGAERRLNPSGSGQNGRNNAEGLLRDPLSS